MKTLSKEKEIQLLDASLEDLHAETLTWLSNVYLWEDETKFYKNILNNKLFQNVTEKDKTTINVLIDKIIGNKLIVFTKELSEHEKNLDTLVQTKLDTGDYRHKHKHLYHQFIDFEKGMKEIKTGVFELLKLVNANYFNGNETLNCIHERRAVRKYKKIPIDTFHIEQIISAGRMAPSAMNNQPWKFYILTNKEKIKSYSTEIYNIEKKFINEYLKEEKDKISDPIFYDAPVVVFITAPKINEWADIDIGMCAQNIMLASKSLGYDSCPIGLAKSIVKTSVYKELKISDLEEIKLALIIGVGDEKPEIHKRNVDNIIYLK